MTKSSKSSLTPLMQQYWDIKAKYSGMILFFRLGDFYEMFGDDAIKAHSILEVVLTQRAPGVPMCGVPYHAVNTYIRKLISKGFKVAICEQLEDPATTKTLVKRGVTQIITPGTVLEDNLLEAKKNNFLMAINLDETTNNVAYAITDISTGFFLTAGATLNTIDSEIARYNPGEILISAKNASNEKLNNVLSCFQITISQTEDSYFELSKSKEIIEETFNKKTTDLGLDNDDIISACGAILFYVKETQPQAISIFSNIKYIRHSDFMFLDNIAIENLELLSSLATKKTQGSLLEVLDSTKTPMGARTIRQWIIKPLFNIEKIKNRQNLVNYFICNMQIRKELIEKFKSISDIERIIARISSGSASPRDLVALKESLMRINEVSALLKDLNLNFPENNKIIEVIKNTIVDNPPATMKDGNVIKQGFNKDLDELRQLSTDAKKFISNLETKEREKTQISNLRIGYTSVFGYYIEVTKSHIPLVPDTYIRKQTLTNCERYITQELKTLEDKILSAQEKTLRLENDIFAKLKLGLCAYCADVLLTSQMIAELDIFSSFAQNAVDYNYSCPQIDNSKDFIIEEGRHPVVERILKQGEFVANDTQFDDNSSILILTGPNMSGKSTYLRQNALIAIMAQIGSYVPAKSVKMGLIDRIFTRIGAGDNLAGGKSTFMVEMMETANILNQYTDRSLIILDEVGRGTSTYDGMSIAWSIIEYFADKNKPQNAGAKILFATHYFELTDLANKLQGVKNFSVRVKEWNSDVVFLHKIVEGGADKSYGIHVAKIAGIPKQVIDKAYTILQKLEENAYDISKNSKAVQTELNLSQPQIIVELQKIDTNNITPMEAFNILIGLKEKYK